MRTISDIIADWCQQETWVSSHITSLYEVSSFGNVRRTGSSDNLAQCRSGESYLAVSFSINGKTVNHRIHKLVVYAFHGTAPFDEAVIMHIDGNPHNNRVDNLRWGTNVENQADRDRHNTKIKGSQVKTSKLVESEVVRIRERIADGEVQRDIAADYGVDPSLISLIKQNRIWSHV